MCPLCRAVTRPCIPNAAHSVLCRLVFLIYSGLKVSSEQGLFSRVCAEALHFQVGEMNALKTECRLHLKIAFEAVYGVLRQRFHLFD